MNFISTEDVEEERVMNSRGDNIKFTSSNNANEVFDKLVGHFVQYINEIQKHQLREVILFLVQFN